MNIRPYQENDERQVTNLWQVCFPDQPSHNKAGEDIARKLNIQRELFLVAEEEEEEESGKIIGSAMAGFDGHRGWVYYVATHPDFQRQGIGAALMKAVEKGLIGIGCSKLNLQVRAENKGVVAFYKKLGYKIEERVSMGRLLK